MREPHMDSGIEPPDHRAVIDSVDRLVDEYRVRCLWFLRPDYYPSTVDERLRVLAYIERHGDREGFRRARMLPNDGSHRLQRTVCRLLAANREASGESYVAGGVALNELIAAARVSRDVDLFHDTDAALAASWQADRTTLEAHGYDVAIVRERPPSSRPRSPPAPSDCVSSGPATAPFASSRSSGTTSWV